MKTRVLPASLAILFLISGMASAQDSITDAIQYAPVSCLQPNQLALFHMNVSTPGDLRAYFRLVNTTEWCWVQGNNVGPVSTVVLPKFQMGQEIEYFFVVVENKRVLAKSPMLYRTRVTDRCPTMMARHSLDFIVDCSHEVSGAANGFLAASSISSTPCPPEHISPDNPQTACQ